TGTNTSTTTAGTTSTSTTTGGGMITIHAKALTDHECSSVEWHFVITDMHDVNAPASITVSWSNGGTSTVALDRVTGNVAHYVTTSNLGSTVTSATAMINSEWNGQFNLSHGPCNHTTGTSGTTSTTTTGGTSTGTSTSTTGTTSTGSTTGATTTSTGTSTSSTGGNTSGGGSTTGTTGNSS